MNPPVEQQTLTLQRTLELPLNGIKLIEASAGTGKTWTIGNLYLRHVLAGRPVAELLVVTFTNAATEELRGRIRARLYQALQQFRKETAGSDALLNLLLDTFRSGNCLQENIERLSLAVRSMDEAAIYTIHGFCQRALADHAFNSGQPFDVELVSDDHALWEMALKDWWRRNAYPLQRRDAVLFDRALGNIDDFMHLQRPMREAFGKTLLPELQDGTAALFNRWHELNATLQKLADEWMQRSAELTNILENSKALSRDKKLPYHKDNLPTAIDALNTWFSSGELLVVPDEFHLLSAAGLHTHSKKTQRGKDPQLEDAFFLACQHSLEIMQTLELDFRVAALREASNWCCERIEQAKQQNRTMAFHDLLTRLHTALQDPHQEQALAGALRQRFPVAMIDEFQDTDAIQYGIFRKLYHDQPDTTLIMIGDPKQAIYSFRGGDIFTYMRARKDAGQDHYTLDTNWRSVPPLVAAVNRIFGARNDPFVYSDAIDYLPVQAATEEERGTPHALLLEHGETVSPLTLWRIPLKADGKPPGKTEITAQLARSTAAEIDRLLRGAGTGDIRLGNTPIRAGDIAVLVRTGLEGAAVRKALQRWGIVAVTVGKERVYESEEAIGLMILLRAIIGCNDRELARTALASSLLNFDYAEIAARLTDEHRWLQWVDHLREFNYLWQRKGFMTMFHAMLDALEIGQHMANGEFAERRLTNLLHLAELLQQASTTHPGLDALLGWYRQQIQDAGEEEAELRLESDEELVKIVTIHASKGLEYPVVFVPFLWGCRAPQYKNTLVAFHDAQHNAFLDAAPAADSPSLRMAEKERLAEDVRLAYVALTRARAKLYIAWGRVNGGGKARCNSGSTALAWLLHPVQTPDDLDTGFPDVFAHTVDIDTDLDRLAGASANNIEILALPIDDAEGPVKKARSESIELSPASFTGHIAIDWRISSFSGLTRDIHQAPHGGSPRSGRDPILDFPAGSHVGLFLHLLLEKLDFQGDTKLLAIQLSDEFAPRFNLDPEQIRTTVAQWVDNLLDTSLDGRELYLRTLPADRRLNELAFDFTVGKVDIDAVNRELDEAAGQTLEKITVGDFRGMVTGIIDLVFEYQGKFYIADYKSNFLGGSLDDYTPDKLRQAVFDRRYDLQYLLYTIALHRYLRQRLDGYRYATHFGGIYYLFLRGMRPESGPDCGVFHDRPDERLIESLDRRLAGEATGETS